MELRLNKVISDSGICSRREADRYIEDGRVTVNGRVVSLGTKVTQFDKICVNGHIIKQRTNTVYIAFNKPAGITCTTDPADPDNIVDYVNFPERIFNIGRLDKPSEGLIFLTNDGNIVNKILRAGNRHEKEYIVTVNKTITPEFEKQMQRGVPILGTVTKPCKLVRETDTRFRIILTQGLNRQIRRMCEALSYEVQRLKRVRIMNITLSGLPAGDWRFLTEKEMAEINQMVKDSVGTEEASQQTSKPKPKISNKKPASKPNSKQKKSVSNSKFQSPKSKKQGERKVKKARR
ncbi:MAG: 23S rRNA pseudouridine(2604) synthase RluF [Bacteroidetes bacterium]|nr:23S rRNA pseudouridine(2604) synthase RluF [Bacteroidota bacterium]MCL2302735.1 23S rRNA pseudouridine(2604) synthase RluF [Lentimicrobiaceae bacterium]